MSRCLPRRAAPRGLKVGGAGRTHPDPQLLPPSSPPPPHRSGRGVEATSPGVLAGWLISLLGCNFICASVAQDKHGALRSAAAGSESAPASQARSSCASCCAITVLHLSPSCVPHWASPGLGLVQDPGETLTFKRKPKSLKRLNFMEDQSI